MSEDITFCSADCENMKCERNKKHSKMTDIAHSFANYENIKGYCQKVEPKKSNYDRIKSMSVEEMAMFLVICDGDMQGTYKKEKQEAARNIQQWLLQEVSENG